MKSNEEKKSDREALARTVIEFYRRELEARYQLENVRRFPEFNPISDARIERLREYFMQRIYPPPEQRKKLDDAFDHLNELLRSPHRLGPLVTTALRSLWRLGHRLPAAVQAGRSTVDAYRETRKLEACLIENAVRMGLRPKDSSDRTKMLQLIAGVPEKDVLRLIRDIVNLFRSLSNVALLETTVDIMKQSKAVMERHPDLYTENERAGLQLGLDIVSGGLALFRDMKPEEFDGVLRGIEAVETDWFARVRAMAAGKAASNPKTA
jgi:hypothetical protein